MVLNITLGDRFFDIILTIEKINEFLSDSEFPEELDIQTVYKLDDLGFYKFLIYISEEMLKYHEVFVSRLIDKIDDKNLTSILRTGIKQNIKSQLKNRIGNIPEKNVSFKDKVFGIIANRRGGSIKKIVKQLNEIENTQKRQIALATVLENLGNDGKFYEGMRIYKKFHGELKCNYACKCVNFLIKAGEYLHAYKLICNENVLELRLAFICHIAKKMREDKTIENEDMLFIGNKITNEKVKCLFYVVAVGFNFDESLLIGR